VRALVIEDETLVAFLIEEMLELMGYDDIAVAATQGEAVERARSFLPDLITVDARLAEGCGVAAALEICAERPVPVVFVTGNASRVAQRVRDPILVEKPFTFEDLTLAVMRARAAPGARPASA
jgi:two-component system, response regulator PdtaR